MPYYQRHLPHWQPDEAWLFITWRLAGSLVSTWDSRIAESAGKAFVAGDQILDRAVTGPTWLKDPRVASTVCAVIQQSESQQKLCKIGGYVVMSNHVHLLAQPLVPAKKLTHWIKGLSAFKANKILSRNGPFWQKESFDRWVRTSLEFEKFSITSNITR